MISDPLIWLGALLVGTSLGLLGSGGSILTLPLLVYVAGEPGKIAVAESLMIVGAVAFAGSITQLIKGNVQFRLVAYFGLPSMFSAYLGAYLSQFVSAQTQLISFAVIMLLASAFMLRPVKADAASQSTSSLSASAAHESVNQQQDFMLVSAGIVVGVMAGLIGVGGGFLIVPALLLIAHVDMKSAISTSLVIITLQSGAGASKYVWLHQSDLSVFNWPLILLVGACALLGVFGGAWIGQRLPQATLKKGFGAALIPLSIFILCSNM